VVLYRNCIARDPDLLLVVTGFGVPLLKGHSHPHREQALHLSRTLRWYQSKEACVERWTPKPHSTKPRIDPVCSLGSRETQDLGTGPTPADRAHRGTELPLLAI
jgi:hypothetical protein